MTLRPLLAAAAALTLSACATATTGTYPLKLAPELAAGSHVATVRMTSEWVRADAEFPETFLDEVHDTLRGCAKGPRKLDLNIHVDQVRQEPRLSALLRGGEHELAAVAELVVPETGDVVGRYPIHVKVDAGGPLVALLGDRQMMVSDAFATELCRQAFGQG